MFTKIEPVQIEQNITSRKSEQRQRSSQQMTLGKPSKEIFLPALPRIGSQNETMIQESLSPSPDDETSTGFMETNVTSPVNGKRVRFSQPLEFWKEFDRDSGQLLDENEAEETAKKKEEYTKERERKSYEEKVSKKINERREKRLGKARVAQTITEAVESLRLQEEKTSVRKFIAHYKRSTARDYRLQSKPTKRGIVCEEENQPFNVVTSDSHQHEYKPTTRLCKLCKFCNKKIAFDNKTMGNSKNCNRTLRLKQKPRASSLPSLDVNDRKLFEERLLPDDLDDQGTLKNHVKYGYYGAAFRGSTSVTYLTPTPLIVQLFE